VALYTWMQPLYGDSDRLPTLFVVAWANVEHAKSNKRWFPGRIVTTDVRS
jgi:hypothetical protein